MSFVRFVFRLRRCAPLLVLAACLAAPSAIAADLGSLRVFSALGEPFRAALDVAVESDQDPSQVRVDLAGEADYRWLSATLPEWAAADLQLRAEVPGAATGVVEVRLSSDAPPADGRFTLLLVATTPQGRSLRQYDVQLFDAAVLARPMAALVDVSAPVAQTAAPAVLTPSRASVAASTPAVPEALARRLANTESGLAAMRRELSVTAAESRDRTASLEERLAQLEDAARARERAAAEAAERLAVVQRQVQQLEQLLELRASAPPPEPPAGDAVRLWLAAVALGLGIAAIVVAVLGLRSAGRARADAVEARREAGAARDLAAATTDTAPDQSGQTRQFDQSGENAESTGSALSVEPPEAVGSTEAAQTSEPRESAIEPGWLDGADAERASAPTGEPGEIDAAFDAEAIEHARQALAAEARKRSRGRAEAGAETDVDSTVPEPSAGARDVGKQTTGDENNLNLARAYIEMGDVEGARAILDEVLREGDPQRVEQARALLARLDAGND